MLIKDNINVFIVEQYLLQLFFLYIFLISTEGICSSHPCAINNTCNFKKIGNKCYYLFKDLKRSWNESQQFCEEQGMTMAIMTRHMIQNPTLTKEMFKDLPNQLLEEIQPIQLVL